MVGGDRSFRNRNIHQDRSPRWSVLHQTRHNGASTDRVRVPELCKKCKDEIGGRLSAVSQDTKQAGNTCATCRGIVDRATASPLVHKRMTGKFLLDVFSGPGFFAKASHHVALRGNVLDTKFGPKVWRDKAPCSHQNSTRRLRWKMCRGNDFTSTTTHFVLFQSYLRQCCRKLASSCSHAVDSGTVWFVVVGRAENPDSGRASHGLGPLGLLWFKAQKANALVGNVDARD